MGAVGAGAWVAGGAIAAAARAAEWLRSVKLLRLGGLRLRRLLP